MKIDWTAVLAVLAAVAAILPQLSKLLGDRSATRIAEKVAEDALSDNLLKRAGGVIDQQAKQIERLEASSHAQAEELARQERQIAGLQARVSDLEREVAAHRRHLAENDLPPLPLMRAV